MASASSTELPEPSRKSRSLLKANGNPGCENRHQTKQGDLGPGSQRCPLQNARTSCSHAKRRRRLDQQAVHPGHARRHPEERLQGTSDRECRDVRVEKKPLEFT